MLLSVYVTCYISVFCLRLVITAILEICISSALRYLRATACIPCLANKLSSNTVLIICWCFRELISATAVVMRIELASLSFNASIKGRAAQNLLNSQYSWESELSSGKIFISSPVHSATWSCEATPSRPLAVFVDPLVPEENMLTCFLT